jgi:hypothetical protein
MREIRITIRSEDFPAVSSSLVKLGVGFQVEPVEVAEASIAPGAPPPAVRRRQVKRKSTKTTRRSGALEAERVGDLTGAARLRAMAERNRATTGSPGYGLREGEDTGMPGADRDADTP